MIGVSPRSTGELAFARISNRMAFGTTTSRSATDRTRIFLSITQSPAMLSSTSMSRSSHCDAILTEPSVPRIASCSSQWFRRGINSNAVRLLRRRRLDSSASVRSRLRSDSTAPSMAIDEYVIPGADVRDSRNDVAGGW